MGDPDDEQQEFRRRLDPEKEVYTARANFVQSVWQSH